MPGFNIWRAMTFSAIDQQHDTAIVEQTRHLQADLTVDIDNAMTELLNLSPSESRTTAIRAIVQSTMDITRKCQTQRAIFQFRMPSLRHARPSFDSRFMLDVNEGDAPELDGTPIGMFLFPRVIKFGDEHGENVMYNLMQKEMMLELTLIRPTTATSSSRVASVARCSEAKSQPRHTYANPLLTVGPRRV